MPNYIAIDPGTSTGIAIYNDGLLYVATKPANEALEYIDSMHSGHFFDTVIVEPFRTAGLLSKYGLETIDLVGQIKGWAYANAIPIVLQTPQSRRAWMDLKLETVKTHNQHEKDALAHLLQYVEKVHDVG